MPLTVKEARRLAFKWVKNQEDIPQGYMVIPRDYNTENQSRRLTIHLPVLFMRSGNIVVFTLAHLLVKDDGTISIRRDRRERIFKKMRRSFYDILVNGVDTDGNALYSHSRAVEIFDSIFDDDTDFPDWLIEVTLAEDAQTSEAADFYAHVIGSKKHTETVVPIKVFTTKAARAAFFRPRSSQVASRTINIMVQPRFSDAEMKQKTYDLLEAMRERF